MTEFREPGFFVDLPGTWKVAITLEPGGHFFHEVGGTGTVTVMLLKVRPSFAIADPARLLSDYMHHRASFEKGKRPSLEQTEPVAEQRDGLVEGSWGAVDPTAGRRQLHRVTIVGDILADFAYEAAEPDDVAFAERAVAILSAAGVDAEPGPGAGEAS